MSKGRTLAIEIVLVTRRDDDRDSLAKVLEGSPWRLVDAGTPEQALAALRRIKFPILLCDPAAAGDCWAEMLHNFFAARRGAYIVLLTDLGENLHYSQFDCLPRPLEREQVFRALFFAYARCKIRWPVAVLARTKQLSAQEHEQRPVNDEQFEASVT